MLVELLGFGLVMLFREKAWDILVIAHYVTAHVVLMSSVQKLINK